MQSLPMLSPNFFWKKVGDDVIHVHVCEWKFFYYAYGGGGMGTLFVLVSPCLRENLVVTYKIGSVLCSLDNLLQKNLIVFFLEIKFLNGTHLKKKRGYFWPTFHIF